MKLYFQGQLIKPDFKLHYIGFYIYFYYFF